MRLPKLSAQSVTQGPLIVNVGQVESGKRRQASGPGLRTFLSIAELWELSEDERLCVLGRPARSTYHLWVSKARHRAELTLPLDTLLRISAVLGVYKGLRIIFTRDADGLSWLKSANAGVVFGGQSPLALVTAGTQDGIMLVRRYLDAWRGGMFAPSVQGFDENASVITDNDIVFL
jgi:hypothetical protein